MPIPLLPLDNRTFDDLFAEMRALIPRYASEWTDHNLSDPGIMLLELFAWATEAMIYRINRVPDASRIRFLELLGAAFQPAQPAMLKLTVTIPDLDGTWTLPRGALIEARSGSGGTRIPFEATHDLALTPAAPAGQLTVRQTARVKNEPLGQSSGERHQHFRLDSEAGTMTLPVGAFPRRPKVWVSGEPWEVVSRLSDSRDAGLSARICAIKPRLNAVCFGDGTHGQIPERGAEITASYRTSLGIRGEINEEKLGQSNGRPHQLFHLSRPILQLDLEERTDFEPQLDVDGSPWTYRPKYLEMGKSACEFTVETRLNAIRFGDRLRGQIPPAGAAITLTYRRTLGARGKPEPGLTTFMLRPGQDFDPPTGSIAISGEFEIISTGADPTTLPEARDQVLDALQLPWRAISAEDFEALVLDRRRNGNAFGIARTRCWPELDLDVDPPAVRPGHISVVIVPDAPPSNDAPTPGQQLIDRVRGPELLDARRLVTSRHHVVGPTYTAARVQVRAIRGSATLLAPDDLDLRSRIEQALRHYFHPLSGGEESTGWPFGRAVYASELYRVVEGVEGVDHVESLSIQDHGSDSDRVAIAPNGLVRLQFDAGDEPCDASIHIVARGTRG